MWTPALNVQRASGEMNVPMIVDASTQTSAGMVCALITSVTMVIRNPLSVRLVSIFFKEKKSLLIYDLWEG